MATLLVILNSEKILFRLIYSQAVSLEGLYGFLDGQRDWIDGLFSKIFREINKTKDGVKMICFDGDVDPNWIENLNSLMDDSKLLTLSNGERILMTEYCKLLFEVGNLGC